MKRHLEGVEVLVPTMYDLPEVMAQSGYSEEQVLDLGISGELIFLVVVPTIGACRVPEDALSHFMAGVDEYTATNMPEHWSGAKSGPFNIKHERLRILADSWETYSAKVRDLSDAMTRQEDERQLKEFFYIAIDGTPTIDIDAHKKYQAERKVRNANGLYTMREAAEVLANACKLNAGEFIKTRMIPAFRDGHLVVVDPRDGGPVVGRRCNDFTDLVTPEGINSWLDSVGFLAHVRWPIDTNQSQKPEAPKVEREPIQSPLRSGALLSVNKAALIAQYEDQWPTIRRDIQDASTNGLSQAAKAGRRDWYEDRALNWARSKNKLVTKANTEASLSHSMNNLVGRKHKLEG